MELTSIAGPHNTTNPAAAAASQASTISSDFETFLKMLTAQMTNQDPLNPIQSTDYATQLATFSSVEQQVKTNDLLTALSDQLGANGLSQLAGWVGMEARVAAPAYFDGEPITLYPGTASTADAATLVVTNAAGQEVTRQQIALGGAAIDWAGTAGNGQPLPSGAYSFSVESYANSKLIETTTAENYALVSEAKFAAGAMVIVLEGGIEIPATDIFALRAPGV